MLPWMLDPLILDVVLRGRHFRDAGAWNREEEACREGLEALDSVAHSAIETADYTKSWGYYQGKLFLSLGLSRAKFPPTSYK